jgi:hypothetical protein
MSSDDIDMKQRASWSPVKRSSRHLRALIIAAGVAVGAIPAAWPACVTKVEPPMPPDAPIMLPWLGNGPKVLSLAVITNTTGGCTLKSGTVKVFLVLDGVAHYCGVKALVAKGSGRQAQVVAVDVPLGAGPRLGTFQVQREVTAVFSDGSRRTEKSTVNYSSSVCPP